MTQKTYFLLPLIILSLVSPNAMGQDLLDSNFTGDIPGYSSEYSNDYQENDSEGVTEPETPPKYTSEKEFADAAATMEKYGMTYTQRKKLEARRKKEAEEEKSRQASLKSLKASPFALLRLPVDVESAGVIINAGYYLVQAQSLNEKNNIVIVKGNEPLLTLHVTDVEKRKNKIPEPTISVENIGTETVNFVLTTKDSTIKFSLPVVKSKDS